MIPGLGSVNPFLCVVAWLAGSRSGCREVTSAAPGVAADSQSGPTGVHLGSRLCCGPESREAVLEGNRWDAKEISIIGAWGTLPAPWLAIHWKTLKITEALGRKQTRGWEAAGGSGAVHQAGAEALEAKEPHMGSPKPRYCLLPRQGQKCQGLDLPFSTLRLHN